MSRRWRGARADLAVVDEVTHFTPPAPAPTSQADVDAELAALREKASSLQARLNEQLRLTSQAWAAADMRAERIRELELVRDGLARKLEIAESHAAGQCSHVAEVRELRVQRAAQDQVIADLQAANEAHDRYRAAAGWLR